MAQEKFLPHAQIEVRDRRWRGAAFLVESEQGITAVTAGHTIDQANHPAIDNAGFLYPGWREDLKRPRRTESHISLQFHNGHQVIDVPFSFEVGRDIASSDPLSEIFRHLDPLVLASTPVEPDEPLRIIGMHASGSYNFAVHVVDSGDMQRDEDILYLETIQASANILPSLCDPSYFQPQILDGMSGFAIIRQESQEVVGVLIGTYRHDHTLAYAELLAPRE